RESVLNMTLDFLRRMEQEDLAEQLHSSKDGLQRRLKSVLQRRFSHVVEGVAKSASPAPLNQLYKELYITEGGASEVDQEHEVRCIEAASRKRTVKEITVKCEDIFKGPAHRQGPIRTVLTTGVAGVGKTVLTQKFSLDWAEGKTNQDVQLLFPFTFREFNVLRGTEFSLVGLMYHFFSETKGLCRFEDVQVLFIFDGLDECRLPLDFTKTKALTDPTESTSIEVLLVNLIRGSLLPSARLWITTRPAAANQIPADCVSMVTEVRGFADPQKEQYFRTMFRDELQATAVISHIKSIRTLYIMCRIPVFCWILSRVLLHLMETRESGVLPHTLTQMYIHFLVVQAKVESLKYDSREVTDQPWTPETRKMVRSLGKLAFEQLQKGNLIFYESDLSDCGLDAAEISVYSGVFTQVFREEPGLYQDKVYCFIHLTVQEFLAALHVHQTFYSSGVNLLQPGQPSASQDSKELFYQSAIDQALLSPNGHWDLFLRFLLGLSLPTNQSLLQGLLPQTGGAAEEAAVYLKLKMNEWPTNFVLVTYSKSLMCKLPRSDTTRSTVCIIACTNVLSQRATMKPKHLFFSSRLMASNVGEVGCTALSKALSCKSSCLTELDLSFNSLRDSGVQLLTEGLQSSHCTVQSLRYQSIQAPFFLEICGPLSSILSRSGVRLLDLSNNDLTDSGVEQLSVGLKSPMCKVETLRFGSITFKFEMFRT
uniref:NACHT domain-containing protein n=1 Tax=Neogobius melanostomus TaxID=47308 RepID=A0A8C6SP26_9GOBI